MTTAVGRWRTGGFATLAAADRLTLAYLAGMAALVAARHPQPLPLLSAMGCLAVAIFATARWGSISPLGRMVHDFFPVVIVVCVFTLSGPVIAIANGERWDVVFAAADRELFGDLPAAWFGLLGRPRWLTDVASILYASYYVIPLAMGVALYRSGRRADFENVVFTVLATFLLSFVCYLAAPTLGPRVPAAGEEAILGGGAISGWLRSFLRHVEWNELDAFPSGHTALSLVYLALGWRLLPGWRAPLLLLVAGIIFSTVYLSLHYVVDLVAGALLAAVMPLLLPLLRRCFAAPQAGAADRAT